MLKGKREAILFYDETNHLLNWLCQTIKNWIEGHCELLFVRVVFLWMTSYNRYKLTSQLSGCL